MGIVAGDFGGESFAWSWLGVCGACVALVATAWRRPRGVLVSAVALALAAGGLAAQRTLARADTAELQYAESRRFVGRVAEVGLYGDRARVRLRAVAARDDGARLPEGVELWLEDAGEDLPAVDDTIRVQARVAPLRGPRNPGERDGRAALRRRGVGARATGDAQAWVRVAPVASSPLAWAGLRQGLMRELGDAPPRSLIRALGIGDPSALGPARRDAFSALGLSHLLAVSGLHLGWIGLAICVALQQAFRLTTPLTARCDPRPLARGLALLAVSGYAALTGLGIPVRRAWVLVAAAAVGSWGARPAPRGQALWVAGAAILGFEPGAVFSAGAQLSFGACAALVWHAGREAREPGAGALRALDASAVATAATAPLAAFHFGVSAPFALLANAIGIPWVTLALLPACLVACVGLAAELPGAPAALAIADALASATLWAVEGVAGGLSARPRAPMPPLLWLAASGVSLGSIALPRRLWRLAGVCLASALFAAIPPATDPGPLPRLVALDVGRGDAVLLQTREGAILVDAGSAVPGRFDFGAQRVVPAARALGIARFDAVFATHADLDHRGGLPAVLDAIPVGQLWLPRGGLQDPGFASLLEAAQRHGIPVHERGLGDPPELVAGLRVSPVWPPRGAQFERNEGSLGLRVEVESRSVLLLGDIGAAEPALLRATERRRLASDVLLLPHHGSRRSGSARLLRRVDPAVTVVSGPCPAQRGLPHPETLARARGTGAVLGWTGRDGAVTVDLRRLVVRSFVGGAAQTSSCSTSRS